MRALSSFGERRLLSSCVQASHCGGFFSCRASALGLMDSVVVECGLSCPLACVLPGLGVKPVFPGLTSVLLTTGPPGKSYFHSLAIVNDAVINKEVHLSR